MLFLIRSKEWNLESVKRILWIKFRNCMALSFNGMCYSINLSFFIKQRIKNFSFRNAYFFFFIRREIKQVLEI